MLKRPRALPLGLLLVAALVLLSAVFATEPIHDAATGGVLSEVTLQRPMGYVAMAPVSDVLDALTLFSLRQHIALLVTILVCYGAWWWVVGRRQLAMLPPQRRALRELTRVGVGLVGLVAIYTAVLILPRPMARLEAGVDIILVDFHAHTKYSHDGRSDWTPEDVRTWHQNAGFNAAYITDHRTFEGARDAWANNPNQVASSTVIIPGIEVVWRGEHVNVLDADRLYRGLLTADLRDVDDTALVMASGLPNNEPVLIQTFPGDASRMVAAHGPGTAGVRALEIVDGAPKGLGQTRHDRAHLVHLADSLNLALVAGSDHHGWGHTAAGWTMLFIPQFRGLAPPELTTQISRILRRGGRGATKVVVRYLPDTDGGLALPFTVPITAWGMMRTLSGDERIVWIAWLVAVYALWRLREARRRPA